LTVLTKKLAETMMSSIGRTEIRVVMYPIPGAGAPSGLVQARAYKKLFDAVLGALIAADREIHPKLASSEFLISHLALGACEFGIVEKVRASGPAAASAVELFRRCAGRVYRSDYQILLQYRRLMRAFQRFLTALDPGYVVVVRYHDTELPLDEFFRRQVDRVGLANETRPLTDMWFAGVVLSAFDGRLEPIDYRGAAWSGRLTLAGGDTRVDCVFDQSMGEDALNPFGNKDVSITGRAIYTGDSQLPERVEVLHMEELPRATAAIDIRGALASASIGDSEDGLGHLDKR
jgi:hypothetical protein